MTRDEALWFRRVAAQQRRKPALPPLPAVIVRTHPDGHGIVEDKPTVEVVSVERNR